MSDEGGEERLSPEDQQIRDRFVTQLVDLGKRLSLEASNPGAGPEVLYHYTSAIGLKGILESGQIWVSRAEALNDPMEIRHAEGVARAVLSSRLSQADEAPPITQAFLAYAKEMEAPQPHDLRQDAFVASFCARGDLLGQWAYYARDGGYNLGFRRQDLVKTVPLEDGELSFELRKVIYKEEDQRRHFDAIFEQFEAFLLETVPTLPRLHHDTAISVCGRFVWHVVKTLAARMKSDGFSPEEEWRLITTAIEGDTTPDPNGIKDAKLMSFRTVGSRFVPYFKADYGVGKLPLVSITSGPTVQPVELAKDAIVRMLKRGGYPWETIDVRASGVILRE